MRVIVQQAAFDPAAELAGFGKGGGPVGAVVSFTGIVRDEGGRLVALEIEHYPGMAERALEACAAAAVARWGLADCLVLHRFGRLAVGAPIVLVATAAPHRAAAFAAAEFLMDTLKSRAPFWKKEITAEGDRWVAPGAADDAALRRW
jgi:molybdopterin synthase catalytic subunit